MFDFPQAQITFLAFLSLAGIFVFMSWQNWIEIVLVIIIVISIVYQLTIIIPYTFFYPVQVEKVSISEVQEEETISVMMVNVYQFNTHYERCINVIKKTDADIFIAVETNEKWREAFSVFEKDYKYNCLRPLDNTYGMLLFSKLELVDTEIKFLVQEHVPSMHTKVRLRSGKEILLYCLHPEPPSPTENESSTERDAELLIIAKMVSNQSLPVIVAGDLNDVAWSHTTTLFQKISRLLDPRIGRGFYNTFHAKYPIFRWPLDHIFHSDHFKLIDLKRLERTGSDHFPMYVKLLYHPHHQHEQEAPEADGDDIEESEEKIDKVKE